MTRRRRKGVAGGLEETLGAWMEAGRIESADSALVEGLRLLAVTLDEYPASPGLWREFVRLLTELREAGSDGGVDVIDELLAEMRAPVDDSED